jgi:hypothetical protein
VAALSKAIFVSDADDTLLVITGSQFSTYVFARRSSLFCAPDGTHVCDLSYEADPPTVSPPIINVG